MDYPSNKELFITHEGQTICYKTFGSPNNPCVILIMGIGGQLIHWPDTITQGLSEKGFYVITFDNRDVGHSSYYDELPIPNLLQILTAKHFKKILEPPYTLNDMADDILILMDKLNIPESYIVGISMGGMISQIFTIRHPNRVLGLTCIASTTSDPHLPRSKPEVLQFFLKTPDPVNDVNSYVNNMLNIYKVYNHPDDFNEDYAKKLYSNAYQRAYHPEGFKRQLLAIITAQPRCDQLKQLDVKSLVIHGDYDPVFPLEHGKRLAQCLSHSQLVVIEKMGHGLPERVHERIVEIIAKRFK